VTQKLGGFPKVGELLSIANFDLRVEKMDGLRVAKLKLTKHEEVLPEQQQNRKE
jgi:Mg2+/Co2+ transporter CorC